MAQLQDPIRWLRLSELLLTKGDAEGALQAVARAAFVRALELEPEWELPRQWLEALK